MKRSCRILMMVALACIALFPTDCARGETKFRYDGQIRIRWELADKDFKEPIFIGNSFIDMRTRLGLRFDPSEWVFAYIQLQDSRRWGEKASGDLGTTDNLDMHQGYIEVTDPKHGNSKVKAGRFELNFGNQRVFGAVGWHNVGRAWDGFIASFAVEEISLDGFFLKRLELNNEERGDFNIVGIYSKFPIAGLEIFYFRENNFDDSGYVQDQLERHNIGAYFARTFENVDFSLQGNFQFGEQPRDTLPDSLVQDISALMIASELGYTFDGAAKARIAGGLDYTSGDDGKDSTKYKAYTNAYYTGHAFRGYMDYFVASPRHGLVDLMFRVSAEIKRDFIVKGDIHYFRAAADYVSLSDSTTLTKNIGTELDLTFISTKIKGAESTSGFSLFFPDKHFAEEGTDRIIGYWFYYMVTVDF